MYLEENLPLLGNSSLHRPVDDLARRVYFYYLEQLFHFLGINPYAAVAGVGVN